MGFIDRMRDWNDEQRAKAAVRMERAEQKMREASPIARFGPFTLNYDGTVTHRDGLTVETSSPDDAVTARVESGADLEKRVTVTRLVMLGGIGGLLWKKRSGGESWLTVEAGEYLWLEKVERKDDPAARQFAAAVNRTSRLVA